MGRRMIKYRVNDVKLTAYDFISFSNQVWKGDYDLGQVDKALSKTLNITAYDDDLLVGSLRILTDGYFLEQLQNCWFCRTIRNRESAVNCSSWRRRIHRQCCTLEHSRRRRDFTRKTDAIKASSLMQ